MEELKSNEQKIMDFVNEQFKTINSKLDKLTELTEQTHIQEYRLNQLEEQLKEIRKSRTDTLSKILTPVVSSLISAIVAFIISGGLKIHG